MPRVPLRRCARCGQTPMAWIHIPYPLPAPLGTSRAWVKKIGLIHRFEERDGSRSDPGSENASTASVSDPVSE